MTTSNLSGALKRRPTLCIAAAVVLGGAFLIGCSNDNSSTPTAAAITVVSGSGQSATVSGPLTAPIVVKVTDASGNAINGATVTFAATGGAALQSPTETTNSSGLATDSVTALGGTAGTETVTASVSGVAVPASFTFTATARAASAVAVVSGSAQTGLAGLSLPTPIVVKVTDATGGAVVGATVGFTGTGGTTLTSATETTDASGLATDSVTALGVLAGADTVTATVSGVATPATFAFTGNAGVADSAILVSGNAQTGTAGTNLIVPIVVQLKDQFGNPVTTPTLVTFTTSAGTTLATPTAMSNATGMATDSITALSNTAGADTVTATVSGVAVPVIFTFTGTAGPATAIAVQSGDAQTAAINTALAAPLVAVVKDQFGNPVAGVTIDWTTTSGALGGPASGVTAADGTVSQTLTLPGLAGPVTVTATIHGTATAISFHETGM